jgi:type VI secretion system secreted protein VgrG
MNLDIHDAVIMAVIIAILGAIFSAWRAVRSIRKSRNVVYYRIRYRLVSNGWWAIVLAAVLVLGAILIGIVAEPVAYIYFPPSPTISSTPTISPTPTISLTPTITETPTSTLTPAMSYTPTITSTPFLPDAIEVQFSGTVTPNPGAVFSRLQFSRSVIKYKAVDPQTSFPNPVQKIFVTYTYDKMANGVQWTILVYRDGEFINSYTDPWGAGTGGSGEYPLDLLVEKWLPGTYQVIFFVGVDWKVVGEFRVTGEPPSATPVPFSSLTPTLAKSAPPSFTPRPSDTRWPTVTK